MSIQAGGNITIEITRVPRSAAGQKTLTRLCRKDPQVARHHRHQQAKRPSWESWIRGGKYWHHQMKSRPAVALRPGARYTIRATLDVIRDLASIESCVKVAAAS